MHQTVNLAVKETPGLVNLLKADFRLDSAWKILPKAFRRSGHLAVFLFRLASTLYAKKTFGPICRSLAMIITRLNTTLTGVDIDPIARVGEGLDISHSVGLTIGPATIGRNATLYHGVTIAPAHHHDDSGQLPMLGDNVTVYCGACIIVPVKIGDGANIGANAVVTRDIPSGMLAVGVPAKIINPHAKNSI